MAPALSEESHEKVRFTEEQMVAILRWADKTPIADFAKKHKISEQTIYNWRVISARSSRLMLSGFAGSSSRTRS